MLVFSGGLEVKGRLRSGKPPASLYNVFGAQQEQKAEEEDGGFIEGHGDNTKRASYPSKSIGHKFEYEHDVTELNIAFEPASGTGVFSGMSLQSLHNVSEELDLNDCFESNVAGNGNIRHGCPSVI